MYISRKRNGRRNLVNANNGNSTPHCAKYRWYGEAFRTRTLYPPATARLRQLLAQGRTLVLDDCNNKLMTLWSPGRALRIPEHGHSSLTTSVRSRICFPNLRASSKVVSRFQRTKQLDICLNTWKQKGRKIHSLGELVHEPSDPKWTAS